MSAHEVTAETTALSVRAVTKMFPGTRALDDVDLHLDYGEVLGLCGGNGSGKSTLIKILSGVFPADSGRVLLGGQDLDASQIRASAVHELGLRVVHQDLGIFPDLSVAENMMLGSDYPVTRAGTIQWRELRRRAIEQIDRFEIGVEPGRLIRDLPVATRTLIAIARALQDVSSERAVVILDEPTASLPAHEAEILHRSIRSLAAQGHAVLIVSHRLDEVMALTDRVTVFRDGQVHANYRTSEITERDLIAAIVGKPLEHGHVERQAQGEEGSALLEVEGLSAGPLRDITMSVKRGEVVGVAGLLGAGRTELLRAICGDLPLLSGRVSFKGTRTRYTRLGQAIKSGIILIPEDRVAGSVFSDLSVDQNIDLSVLDRYWRGLGFKQAKMRADAGSLRERFRVKAPSGGTAMSALSGGNQQKAVLARWLRREPILLLLDEPTQGIDVGARAEIYRLVREVTDAGGAAIVVASDLEELAQVSDRAVVLKDGRLTDEVPLAQLTAHHLNELIYLKEQSDHEQQ